MPKINEWEDLQDQTDPNFHPTIQKTECRLCRFNPHILSTCLGCRGFFSHPIPVSPPADARRPPATGSAENAGLAAWEWELRDLSDTVRFKLSTEDGLPLGEV